jgi:hypothetical protein
MHEVMHEYHPTDCQAAAKYLCSSAVRDKWPCQRIGFVVMVARRNVS